MKIKFNKLLTLSLACGLIFFGSCKENEKIKDDKSEIEIQVKTKSDTNIDKNLLIGSWLDASEAALHFSLFEDETSRSDNMKTLLYEKWRLEGNKLILTVKSIGNDNTSVSEEKYLIEELTDKKMVLKDGKRLLKFKKKD